MMTLEFIGTRNIYLKINMKKLLLLLSILFCLSVKGQSINNEKTSLGNFLKRMYSKSRSADILYYTLTIKSIIPRKREIFVR